MRAWAALAFVGWVVAGRAQQVADAPQPAESMSFRFDSPAPALPSWEIVLAPDHTGSYRRLGPNAPAPHPVQLSEATWQKLAVVREIVQDGHCETKSKHIAQTGAKTLAFGTGAAASACTFNYSDSDKLNDVVATLQAVAATVEAGDKLSAERRFDRLALDADITALSTEVDAGRALELRNIASTLRAIAEDDRVIDRARRKAARLLQAAGEPPPALPDAPR